MSYFKNTHNLVTSSFKETYGTYLQEHMEMLIFFFFENQTLIVYLCNEIKKFIRSGVDGFDLWEAPYEERSVFEIKVRKKKVWLSKV